MLILARIHILVRCRQSVTFPWLAWTARLAWHQGFMPMICCSVPRRYHLLQEPQFSSTTVPVHLSPLSLCWSWELLRASSLERSWLGTGEFPGDDKVVAPVTQDQEQSCMQQHPSSQCWLGKLLCLEGSGIYECQQPGLPLSSPLLCSDGRRHMWLGQALPVLPQGHCGDGL